MATVSPYLGFPAGKTEEAFAFYQSVFGGDLALTRFADMDMGDMPMSDEAKQMVAHVSLPIGDGLLHGSDQPEEMGELTVGDNVSVMVEVDSADDAERFFNALADGGQVAMPMGQVEWAERYGMCTDKFGIGWQINYTGSVQFGA